MIAHADIQLALRAQALPALQLIARAWENVSFTRVAGTPYCEEDYVPATSELKSIGTAGAVELTGLYVIRLYGIANTGLGDLGRTADALLAQFPLGRVIPLETGSTTDRLRVRGDQGPYRGQIRQASPGFALCVVTVPWRCATWNSTTP